MDQLMLKPAEVARLIGVGKTQVYRLIKARELPSRRVGKSIRIPVAELKAWATSAAVDPAPSLNSHASRKGPTRSAKP